MSRTYSEAFLIELHKADPGKVGTALALACVKANLPAKYIAAVLEVTRMTMYSWFRGKPIRHKNMIKAEVLTDLIESDTAKGILPAQSAVAAKAYLEDMVGRKF